MTNLAAEQLHPLVARLDVSAVVAKLEPSAAILALPGRD